MLLAVVEHLVVPQQLLGRLRRKQRSCVGLVQPVGVSFASGLDQRECRTKHAPDVVRRSLCVCCDAAQYNLADVGGGHRRRQYLSDRRASLEETTSGVLSFAQRHQERMCRSALKACHAEEGAKTTSEIWLVEG